MVQGIFVWLLTFGLAFLLINLLRARYKFLDRRFLLILFLYHTGLAIAYYLYALSNPSDSNQYYSEAVRFGIIGEWFDFFGDGTEFIEFMTYPFVNYLDFSYEACMIAFSFFGYVGFVFFFVLFSETITSKPTLFGLDATRLIFLLPNLHFWSSSLGKGSVIFLAFGLFFYGLRKPGNRMVALAIGGLLMYLVRSHIFFVVLIAIAVGYTFSLKGVNAFARVAVLVIAGIVLFNIYNDILAITGFDDESVFDPLVSHRASELSKATSGIDLTSYSLLQKLFAFCFRPLFFDAPGMLGLIVSFENLFYLIVFARLLLPSNFKNLITADALVKTCLLTFGGVSLALAQISGNLGLAMRQKSQVMILMMFVVVKLLDAEKKTLVNRLAIRNLRKEKLKSRVLLKQPTA